MAATADVLITSGALPVDLGALRAANPGLITVSISAFGDDGPKASWAASDLVVAASSGELVLNGDADRAPVRIGEPQAFHHAAIEAAAAVAVALWERGRSGRGQHLDVSAQQALIQATQITMLAAAVGSPLSIREAGGIRIGPYRLRFVYPARDGYVSVTFLFGQMIGAFTQRLMSWVHEQGFCSQELAELDYISFFELLFSGRLEPAVLTRATDAVAELTATMTKAELLAVAQSRRLLIVPVTTTADVVDMEQFGVRGYWDELAVEGRAGRPVRAPGPWARATATPLRRLERPPRLGEHDDRVPELIGRRPTPTVDPGGAPGPGGRALEGLKVLDFSWVLAGPMATKLLADHGATVVRIETETRPDVIRAAGPFLDGLGGIEDTALWHSVAAGKQSIQLDVSTSEARAVVLDLVRWADLVMESFTPGVMTAMGFDYETLRQVNPRLVMVSSSLWGQTGPFTKLSGFGNLAAAVTGWYEITGWPDRAPAGPFMAYTDYVSPRFFALAALAAVDHARRTGEGQYVDVSQAEATLQLLSPALLDWEVNGRMAGRHGNDDPDLAPHGVYPAGPPGEDRWLAVVCTDDEQWRRLAAVIGRAELADLTIGERLERRGELDEAVAAWSAGRDPVGAQEELQRAGVAAHQVQHSAECLADPQLAHRGHFLRAPHPVHGHVWVEGAHVRFSRTPGGPAWAGPTLGQHTDQVLRDLLGYDDDRITDLVIAGALR